jgi:spermidine synthase
MKPWILLDSAPIPGGGVMTLHSHVRDFAIRVGRDELMNSGAHGSEEALADLAAKRLGMRAGMQVLVGGLGMGFTVAAALRVVPDDGRITVAELVPAVVAWNRGPLAHLAGNPLGDPRVEVHTGDVAALLRSQAAAYDLILLDVDNGPHGLTTGDNHWLYGLAGLAAAHRALRPGGVLAVWSAGPDDAFTRRLGKAGFAAEAVRVAAHGGRGRKHVIWLATARQR